MKAWSLLLLFGLAAPTVRADDPQDPDREARYQYVVDKFAEWSLSRDEAGTASPPKPLKNQLAPLLRYTNPSGGLVKDGTLFVWRDGIRPIAACSFSIRGPEDPDAVFFEMTSLVGTPLRCERRGQARWTPKRSGLLDQAVPETGVPEDRPVARLTTMRNIARRFEAENFLRDGKPNALRLMPQPIDRYQDEAAGLLDAGMFAFVEANDPEILLLIEARKGADGEKSWRYTVARMTSRQLEVRLDGKQIFTAANFWQNPKSPDDPYLEARDGVMVLDPPAQSREKPATGAATPATAPPVRPNPLSLGRES
ncbi:hypothetical protein [Planctomyces sp. SH-PL14]|uniref:hypothetical protein n=1 Tax=Planctomyces sp. SH-PL14 TaxID=1632864 RepID=UPI00078D9717|nr:hypothetical protein [Planctomyces sp. SH-PL14]AMV20853.1 hypothetical protein VT03_23325 [Planctomyces sp. SH-PL14]